MRRLLSVLLLTGTALTLAVPASAGPPPPRVHVAAYEDGSGKVTWKTRGRPVSVTIGEGILPWDCTANGNLVCGPTAPPEVRQPSCTTFVVRNEGTRVRRSLVDHLAVRYCTDSTWTTRWATDVDVEGEVL